MPFQAVLEALEGNMNLWVTASVQKISMRPTFSTIAAIWRVGNKWSDLTSSHSSSQQFTTAHV